jgi:hypothetical protein
MAARACTECFSVEEAREGGKDRMVLSRRSPSLGEAGEIPDAMCEVAVHVDGWCRSMVLGIAEYIPSAAAGAANACVNIVTVLCMGRRNSVHIA